jgi:transcriptional regulator with XRE-family HTH domain
VSDYGASYLELADLLNSLPLIVREARRARNISQKAAAEQIGITDRTIRRLENGEDVNLSTAVALLRWLPASDDVLHHLGAAIRASRKTVGDLHANVVRLEKRAEQTGDGNA